VTLTELRYIVAVARERHFGHAAEACFVSQPTLSVAVKKLEEELGVPLFERGPGEVTVTPAGQRIVEQAQRVLEEASRIKEIAVAGRDPIAGPLRLGAIYTIGPYLLPKLIPILRKNAPAMQLLIQENFTHRLGEMLKNGEVDAMLIALPYDEAGVLTRALYDEPFFIAVPKGHPWETRKKVSSDELMQESLLLLGEGHCFRDQVLEICHTVRARERSGLSRTVEGGSLETIRQMVAGGVGVTVLPATSVAPGGPSSNDLIRILPFARPVPIRRVGLAWRRSFPRPEAIEALCKAILAVNLPLVTKVEATVPVRPAAVR
jgi:LysR family hydrogen peroxide-inducible transcriptional activator